MLPQIAISILAVVAVVFIAFYGFTTGGYFIHAALIGTPVLLFLVNNPSLWLVLILGLIHSKLIFPGIPQGLQVVHVMMAGFTAMMIARNIIVKPDIGRPPTSTYFLYGFLLVLVVTIYLRGFGIRAFGGNTWGGMSYVKIFLAAGFLFVSRYIALNPRQIKAAILLMIATSLLPFLAQLIFLASKGRIYQQYMFVEAYVTGLLGALNAASTGTGIVRYHAIGSLAFTMLMAGFVLIKPTGMKRFGLVGLVLVCLFLSGLSGFRGQIINMVALVTLYTAFLAPEKAVYRLLLAGGLVVLGLVALYPFISYLPAPVQRALSFLPGADVRADILFDAKFSTEWRIRIWDMALAELPKYLVVGKGLAYDPGETLTYTAMRDSILSAYLAHNYHSGPLSLLLDTGVLGFAFAFLFMLFSTIEVWKSLRAFTKESVVRRFYLYMAAGYIYSTPAFFLIYGDLPNTFPAILIGLATLNAVRQAHDAETKHVTTNPRPILRPGQQATALRKPHLVVNRPRRIGA